VLLRYFRGAATSQPTVFYTMDPDDDRHDVRLLLMGAAYHEAASPHFEAQTGSTIAVNDGRPLLTRPP
jgi:hypothetical protein